MKKILIIPVFLMMVMVSFSQTRQYDIKLMPALETKDEDIATYAKDLLLNKVKEEITRDGCTGVNTSRFMVLVHPEIMDKQSNGQLVLFTYNLQFSIVDLLAEKSYNHFSIQMGGTGRNGGQAIMDAIRKLDLSKSKLADNIKEAVGQIIQYYTANCSSIIARSNVLMNTKQFTEALATLAMIPEVNNLPCFNQYNTAYTKAYQQYAAYRCNAAISEAKTAWSLSPNIDGVKNISQILSGVEVTNECKKDFSALTDEIKRKLTKDEFDDKKFREKVYETGVDLEKNKIAAIRDIAVEYYKNKMPVVYLHL